MKKITILSILLVLLGIRPVNLISQCATGIVNMNYYTSTSGAGTYADPALGNIEYGFCFTLQEFFEKQTNWVHGIFVRWGDVPVGVHISKGLTGEQPAEHGSRNWIWIDSLKARQLGLPGIGYYVDDGDDNPTNNYGDNGLGTPIATFPSLSPFCFIANYTCGQPSLHRPIVTVTGDGTTGAWKNSSCPGDAIKATKGGPTNEGILIACGLILPLELLSFNGYNKDGVNYINWSGISDDKFSHYELEKRTETELNFSKISDYFVPFDSRESSQHNVNLTDIHIEKDINYYRLKMVEKDNTFVYSKTITIKNVSPVSVNKTTVYPNPIEDEIQVLCANSITGITYHLELLSMDGKIIIAKDFTVKGSGQKQKLNVSTIQSGVYFLKLGSENEAIEVFKLIKK
ncbi:MAG: T9SS type A sorting domain-containing protein [Saprospiraceae bacterium]